jgi:NAD(P)-dependent dehydrogenase (short-subunit alcohol dehydrogenase family)
MGKLDDKVAIVTGAAGGIGAASALLFVQEGARVLLVDRDEQGLHTVADGIEPDRVAIQVADVSSPTDTERYVAHAVERFGGLDVLFANAGVEGTVAPIRAGNLEEFDRVIAINLRGAWLGLRAAIPRIAERGGGSIVLTSSVAGLVGSPGLAPYVASKHALVGLAKAAAIECAPLGIRVNCVNPGPIENRMMRSIEEQLAPGAGDKVKQGFLSAVPLRRYGLNEEIARMVLFLASSDSSYSTGAVFLADGGFVTG